jgi:hypothetical protein
MSGIWVLFSLFSLVTLSISNFFICIIGVVLSSTNTLGYIKCDKNHQKKMGSYLLNKAKSSFSKEQIAKIGMYAIG